MTSFICPTCHYHYELMVKEKIGFLCDQCKTAFDVYPDGKVAKMPYVDAIYCGNLGNVCTGFGGKKGKL